MVRGSIIATVLVVILTASPLAVAGAIPAPRNIRRQTDNTETAECSHGDIYVQITNKEIKGVLEWQHNKWSLETEESITPNGPKALIKVKYEW